MEFHPIYSIVKESYTQAPHYNYNFCISYRSHPASRRHLRANPRARRGFLWSSSQRCWINWNSKLRFGRTPVYWVRRHLYRQAPEHNPIISKLCNLLLITICAFKLLELNENTRCIILGSYWLNTRFESELDALLIGSVKVEWLPVTHELIGVDCLLPATTIRIMGGFVEVRLCWWTW